MNFLFLKKLKYGKGVFTRKVIKKGEIILKFKGKVIKRKDLPELIAPEDDRYVQIDKYLYLGPSGNFDDFVNHSCDPNTGLVFRNKKIFLIAIKNIGKGDELVWDYSTTMNEDDWEMICDCKQKSCRKVIKDFKYLPLKLQKKYIKLGIVPSYAIKC